MQKPNTYNKDDEANTVHHQALMACLSYALDNEKLITQLDISSAYLYADLEEELYIPSLPHMDKKGKSIRLKKSLYGLKQSGANWYKKIKQYLIENLSLTEVPMWPCVFYSEELITCLVVDDMIFLTDDLIKAEEVVTTLRKEFDTKLINDGNPKDGVINYDILGLEVNYEVSKSLKFGMEKSLATKLPKLGVDLHINSGNGYPVKPNEYLPNINKKLEYKKADITWLQRIVGLLSYVAIKYRFDLLYHVNVLAKRTLYPSIETMELARI